MRKVVGYKILIASVLVAISLVVIIGGTKFDSSRVTQAQSNESSYNVTWQAKELIVGRLRRINYGNTQESCTNPPLGDYGDPPNSEVAMGVAQWEVKGQIGGGTKFKEVWDVPSMQNPTRFTLRGSLDQFNRCRNYRANIIGINQSEWLIGWTVPTLGFAGAVEFRRVGINEALSSIHNYDPARVTNTGKASSCQRTNRCLYATGPYSFETYHEFDEAMTGKHVNTGMLMPLKWTVTGFICEGSDGRCD